MRIADTKRGAAILDPRFLAALAVLLVNDHWAKAQFPGLITGKVSDFAGMIVLPVLLAALAKLAFPSADLAKRIHLSAVAVSAAFMIAIKTSDAAASAVVSVLETLTLRDHQIIVDPLDLVGLLALPAAHAVLRRPVVWSPKALMRPVRWFAIAIALGACMASSYDEPSAPAVDLEVLEDGAIVERAPWSGLRESWNEDRLSNDYGITWTNLTEDHPGYIAIDDPAHPSNSTDDYDEYKSQHYDKGPVCLSEARSTCARIDSNGAIEESVDGGVTWSTIAEWDYSEWWLDNRYGNYREATDIVRASNDSLLVSIGRANPVRRDPSTHRWSTTQADINPMMGVWLAVVCLVQMYLFQSVRWNVAGLAGGGTFITAMFTLIVGSWMVQTDDTGLSTAVAATAIFIVCIHASARWLSRRHEFTGTKTFRVWRVFLEPGLLAVLVLFGLNWLIFSAFDRAWVSWETGHVLVVATTFATVGVTLIAPLKQIPFLPQAVSPPSSPFDTLMSGASDDIRRLRGKYPKTPRQDQ